MMDKRIAESSSPTWQAWHAAVWLGWREMLRFFRQRNRVIGALGQPLIFWLLFGTGLQSSFRIGSTDNAGPSFLEYFFPGTLVLILLFTAIFATISIIEDRREGFLQGVLVAPIPRWSMVLGKVMGGTLIAFVQALIFLGLGWLFRVEVHAGQLVPLALLLFVSALALTSLGFVIAWRMESTQGFHAIMNLLLMPMWLLSGAFFPAPAAGAAVGWSQLGLHWCVRLNPVTYCVSGVRYLLTGSRLPEAFFSPSLASCWGVTLGFALVMFVAACRISAQRTTGDLL